MSMRIHRRRRNWTIAALALAVLALLLVTWARPSTQPEESEKSRGANAGKPQLQVVFLSQGTPKLLDARGTASELLSPVADTSVNDFDAISGLVVAARAGALGIAAAGKPVRWIDLREKAGSDFYASVVRLSPAGDQALVGGYNAGAETPGFRLVQVDIAASEATLVEPTVHQRPLLLKDIRYARDGKPYVLLVDESIPASKLFVLRQGSLEKVWDSSKILPAEEEPTAETLAAEWVSVALADFFPRENALLLVVYVVYGGEELAPGVEVWVFDLAANATVQRFPISNPNPTRYFDTSFAVHDNTLYFARLGGLGSGDSPAEPMLPLSLHELDLKSGSVTETLSLSVDNTEESPFYRVLLYPQASALAVIHSRRSRFHAQLLSFNGLPLISGRSEAEMDSERLLIADS